MPNVEYQYIVYLLPTCTIMHTWLYPIMVVALFGAITYSHVKIDKTVSSFDPATLFRIFLYVGLSSTASSMFISAFSEEIQEFICTLFNLPFTRTKQNVEVFTGEPAF